MPCDRERGVDRGLENWAMDSSLGRNRERITLSLVMLEVITETMKFLN